MPVGRMLLLASLLWLSSCRGDVPPLKVGIGLWPGYEPLYLADQQGHYPDVDIVRLTSTLDVLRALRNGNLNGAALTLDETLKLLDEGIDLVIILVLDYSNGADVVMARDDIKSLQDLQGKRIGLETNAVGALILQAMLKKSGLTPTQLQVNFMPMMHLADAVASGRIDAAIAYEPYVTELRGLGMKEIFSSADMPGQILDVLVVRRDVLPLTDQLQQLLNGYYLARRYMQQNPQASTRKMANDMGVDSLILQENLLGIYLPSLQENRQLLAAGGDLHAIGVHLRTLMREEQLIQSQPDLLPHIDGTWLQDVTE